MICRVWLAVALAVSLLEPAVALASDADELDDLPPAVPAGTYVGSVDDEIILATAWSDIDTKIKANRVELRVAEDGSVGGKLEFEERGIAQAAVDPTLKCPGGGSRLLAKIDPGQMIGPELPQKLHVSLEYELYSTYTGKITPKEVEHWCIEPRPTIHTDQHEMVITGYASGKVAGTVEPWAFELVGGDPGAADPGAVVTPPDGTPATLTAESGEAEAESDAPGDGAKVPDAADPAPGSDQVDLLTAPSHWIANYLNTIAAASNVTGDRYDAITNLARKIKGSGASEALAPEADTRPDGPPPKMKPKHVKAGRQWVSLDADHEVDRIVIKKDPSKGKRRPVREGRITLTTGTWYQAKERTKDIVFYDTKGKPIAVAGRDDKRGLQYETWPNR